MKSPNKDVTFQNHFINPNVKVYQPKQAWYMKNISPRVQKFPFQAVSESSGVLMLCMTSKNVDKIYLISNR